MSHKLFVRFALSLVLVPSSFSAALANDFSVPLQQEKARQGLELLLRRDYDPLETFLTQLTRDWPEELLGRFGMMVMYQVRNLENYDYRFDAAYERWSGPTRAQAILIAKSGAGSAWDDLMAGGVLGISGFYEAHNHRWFNALRDGIRGARTMERAFQKDPTLYDALLGIGLYEYWRSHLTRRLRFLPFFADHRPEGLEKIRMAGEKGSFVGPAAAISLLFIDAIEKREEIVLTGTHQYLERTPKNIVLRMLEGETLLRLKRIPEAAAEFDKILAIDPTISRAALLKKKALEMSR